MWSHGLQPVRLLCPWDSPGKNTGVCCHLLLQGIFPTQESNPCLLHSRQILYQQYILQYLETWSSRFGSPLNCKEIKPVNPKGNKFWIFVGRTDAEAETPRFCHLMQRADSLEKTLMLGKIEGKDKGTEDKVIGWHHWLSELEFEQAPADGEGQGRLVCCSPWGHKESDTT